MDTLISVVTAVAAVVAAAGVWFAWAQLDETRRQAGIAFEDGLVREYRQLVADLPPTAFSAGPAPSVAENHRHAFFRYFDLSNHQLFLIRQGRISHEVSSQWREGIAANMELPQFSAAWRQVRDHSRIDFLQDLRDLTEEVFPDEEIEARARATEAFRRERALLEAQRRRAAMDARGRLEAGTDPPESNG